MTTTADRGPTATDRRTADGVDNVDALATEQARDDLLDLDRRSAADLVATLLAAEAQVPAVMAGAADALTAAVDLAERALRAGGRLLYVGAGTPGRLAAQDAAECPPTYGVAPDRVVAVIAGGSGATETAVEGAEDDEGAGARDLARLEPGPDDVVVGISASGRTPYVLAALTAAREAGAATVAVANNPGSAAGRLADVAVELPTGAEVVAGSTRLTAGTAQKVALNVISTGAMVRWGRTYGPWMVDVAATNDKLRRRAERIVREVTGADADLARTTLAAADGSIRVALVALLGGLAVPTAAARVEAVGGDVRAALAADAAPGEHG